MLNVFLDDEREPPKDGHEWIIVRTSEACIQLLEELVCVDRLSLDHDLGENAGTGYEVALFLEGRAASGRRVANHLSCHSANPPGRARIERAFDAISRYLDS